MSRNEVRHNFNNELSIVDFEWLGIDEIVYFHKTEANPAFQLPLRASNSRMDGGLGFMAHHNH